MVIDTDKLEGDSDYRADLRHRFLTDHFFAAELMGFHDFIPRIHAPAAKMYGPKNPNISLFEQCRKRNLLHLDPRHTFKTTLKRIDRLQWICAFPEEVTFLCESATQPLAEAIGKHTAKYFFRRKGTPATVLQTLFFEIVTEKDPQYNSVDAQRWAWNTPNRRLTGAGDLDATIAITSPQSTQSGWHPTHIDPDDVEDTKNSGITANAEVRQNVIAICNQNENLLRRGGYITIGGTRYHPFDWYGECVKRAARNPKAWDVLVRASVHVRSGRVLMPGEFPEEEDLDLQFPELAGMDYATLRDMFLTDYETFMCFRGGSLVLMADWTEKPIEQVKEGDDVIGFSKNGPHNFKFQKTKVMRLFSRRAEVAKVTTDTGRILYPTFDHRFLRPPNGQNLHYAKLCIGSKMVSVYTPKKRAEGEDQRDFDWLAGIMDGEGSVSRTGICIYQKQASNPEVHAKIIATLARLGIGHCDTMTHERGRFSLAGGRSLLIQILQNSRTAKRSRILATLWASRQITETCGRRGGESYPTVSTMESIGEDVVYDFETETHNFVCDGFAVHNCQQQNDPQGGNIPTFPEQLYAGCLIAEERIPRRNDAQTFICWRPRYGGKPAMRRFSEGACATLMDGKVYITDAWQGTYTPSGEAERIVGYAKQHDAEMVMLIGVPGSDYLAGHIRNEAARKNRSVRVQWIDYEEDDNARAGAIRQLEPLMKIGRVLFSTAITRAADCQKQFVHFGLAEENGIIECISRFANLIPLSQMRANMQEEEIEQQRRRREDALVQSFLEQQGMPAVDEEAQRRVKAHQAAMARATTWGMPPLPGGLDG